MKNHQLLRFSGCDWIFFSICECSREQCPKHFTWKFKDHQNLRFYGRDWSFFQLVNARDISAQQLLRGSSHGFYHDRVTSGKAQQAQRSTLLSRAREVCE